MARPDDDEFIEVSEEIAEGEGMSRSLLNAGERRLG